MNKRQTRRMDLLAVAGLPGPSDSLLELVGEHLPQCGYVHRGLGDWRIYLALGHDGSSMPAGAGTVGDPARGRTIRTLYP